MVTVKKLHPHFMAAIGDVDLTQPVSAAVFSEIEAAFNANAVLLFRDQPVTEAQQVAFSALFGSLIPTTNYHREGEKSRLRRELADVSNIDHKGQLLAADDDRRLHSQANQLWHTDASFKHVPARCSLLSAHEVPPSSGETEFADLRAAYDALREERKREIEGLVAEHSILRSREQMGFAGYNEAARAELPPVQQVLTRVHPGSGRKTLYLAAHASHIIGWPVEKGRRLIEALIAHATQPEFTYRHEWRVGDLIIWDNRCTMHRARPYEDLMHRRDMRRSTVSDEINTVEALGGTYASAL
jgi:alpha-ketoglutarate-dependent 2,4-dichlorophenoxyacetate dioxygenase